MELYEAKEKEIGSEKFREIERIVMLKVVDQKWMNHIDNMDELEDGIAFLKNLNLLYTEVVSNHKLYIRYNFSEAKRDFEKLSRDHQILISNIVDEYIHFIK